MVPAGMQTCCCYGASAIITVKDTANAAILSLQEKKKKAVITLLSVTEFGNNKF